MEINTILLNMDVLVSEQVVENCDGSYSIFINSRLTHERQMEAYVHALKHINNSDFSKECADEIESATHDIDAKFF